MFKKIKEVLDYWDLKSFFTTIAILGAFLTIGFFFSDIRDRFRTSNKGTLKGRTTAKVISIKALEKIRQGHGGTRIEVDGYEVSYSYNVNGQTFLSIDRIPLSVLNMKLLKELMNKGANDSVMVAFDIGTPKKSMIIESH